MSSCIFLFNAVDMKCPAYLGTGFYAGLLWGLSGRVYVLVSLGVLTGCRPPLETVPNYAEHHVWCDRFNSCSLSSSIFQKRRNWPVPYYFTLVLYEETVYFSAHTHTKKRIWFLICSAVFEQLFCSV